MLTHCIFNATDEAVGKTVMTTKGVNESANNKLTTLMCGIRKKNNVIKAIKANECEDYTPCKFKTAMQQYLKRTTTQFQLKVLHENL